jgi:glycosyltransferase involved in cell wall biosynthesis
MPSEALQPAPESALISLIVCTFGRASSLQRLLHSLTLQQNARFEVILVDQNPPGTLDEMVAPFARQLTLRHVRSAKGLSRARNVGLTHCAGAIVGFPDDDCWYDPGVTARVAALFANSDVAVFTGRTLDRTGAESVSSHRSHAGAIHRLDVFYSGNSNALFVRTAVARAVGFDETLGVGAETPFQSGEETDFLLRILATGATGFYTPDLIVRHDPVDSDAQARLRRARGYSVGFGRVLRLHRFGWSYLGPRLVRSAVRGALFFVRGDRVAARERWGWALGSLRGYRARLPGASRADIEKTETGHGQDVWTRVYKLVADRGCDDAHVDAGAARRGRS